MRTSARLIGRANTATKGMPAGKDWSAAQYLKFGSHRSRPVHDLIAQIRLRSPPRSIVDLGCGPGNSTAILAERFTYAQITGIDSSPDMLREARAIGLPSTVVFAEADVEGWAPKGPFSFPEQHDLVFSNAMFQWLRSEVRVPTVVRLLTDHVTLGGVLAFQVPDNYGELSHKAMRKVAGMSHRPWGGYFKNAQEKGERPHLDPIENPVRWHDALAPHCVDVDIWHTRYHHFLNGPEDIMEWVKGTGLQPFLRVMPEDGGIREAYLKEYETKLAELYPRMKGGKVMLRYPRLFVVAYKR